MRTLRSLCVFLSLLATACGSSSSSNCKNSGDTCNTPSDCCGSLVCLGIMGNGQGANAGTCGACRAKGASCTTSFDCCGSVECLGNGTCS